MVNWCLSYNEITLLQTLFCKWCQKIPHEAVYLDIIQGLCLNVSGSIFILVLFLKITPRASRNEDMWKTISWGSSKPLDKLCNRSCCPVALQFHSFSLGEGWILSGENLDSYDVHSIWSTTVELKVYWALRNWGMYSPMVRKNVLRGSCELVQDTWWGSTVSIPTKCCAVTGE